VPVSTKTTGDDPRLFGMVPGVDDAMNAQRAVSAAFKRAFA
jgi:hypothetical protein